MHLKRLLLSGKTFSYGFREAGPLCETHCKPRSGAAVGGQGCKGRFPEGGLMPLAVIRMCKSRFAEHFSLIQLYPQLRRSAACSGFRIEVPLRGTRSQKFYRTAITFLLFYSFTFLLLKVFFTFKSLFYLKKRKTDLW